MVIKVLFNPVNHPLVIVFNNTFSDVLALQLDPLLPPGDGINQVGVVVISLIVEMVLFDDMLLLPQEIVNLILVSVGPIVLLARGREKPDDNSGEEVGP